MGSRYALIIAGGSGTRLWPMSTAARPKQLLPLIEGRSLLELAVERAAKLVGDDRVYICAGQSHREAIMEHLNLPADRYIGEPEGRDTLNAVGLGTGVLGRDDPAATVAVLTADHLIEPVDTFRDVLRQGFELAEQGSGRLVTFGINPTHAATGYGYLELGEPIGEGGARQVDQFKEKPEQAVAQRYLEAGPQRYLWNSGMFVWQAQTLMRCIERFVPENHAGLTRCIESWGTASEAAVLGEVYPQLDKVSVDYAVMEPASQAADVEVAAVPMPVRWLDVGSWPSYAQTLDRDDAGNAVAGASAVLHDSRQNLVVSEQADHLIATLGVEGLIVVHTPHATLICRAEDAERIKELHGEVDKAFK